ncbi:hypothetical protein [Bdellovibrio svalbardensis]|uniref:Uncharacterized protein n=1 Tax=Bdellovibrio svalbardensis TaxID=2972972 RepID=A0ABT6DMT3_9BACT|nr:hypothetical protein [Bdellovibrio svalbardensis]MDG0817234.1 hypothetical protein [Bdellovibrio svalbardensis]
MKCYIVANCGSSFGGGYSGNPSTGSQIKINPSSVPTEKGFGIEALFFKDSPDFAFVQGLGRVGAAISPSNSEETFFGPPGFESMSDLFYRKEEKEKYPNQKITLATAFNLFEKTGSVLGRYSLKLGLMGKYNKLTNNVSPGGGLSGVLGPLYFGYSIYDDEVKLEQSYDGNDPTKPIKYQVRTYNLGLFLNSLILDYSNLRMQEPHESSVSLFTASLMVSRFIITASKRIEDSPRPFYNYDTQQLEFKQLKEDYFGGVQYSASNHFMFGVLYNYYLLREVSGSLTVFF